jgi:hypothetical protein
MSAFDSFDLVGELRSKNLPYHSPQWGFAGLLLRSTLSDVDCRHYFEESVRFDLANG